MTNDLTLFGTAACAIREASALVVTAGAGMGVDSGLPDFRGSNGLWTSNSPLSQFGSESVRLFTPSGFLRSPQRAWGFYARTRDLFRRARPHEGFEILRRLSERVAPNHFVFTSNVDGHFQRAGFDPARIVECHGSMEFLQCFERCGGDIFPAERYRVTVDVETSIAREPLPTCPSCGALARSNVLMFGDHRFDRTRTEQQRSRFSEWFEKVLRDRKHRLVVIECGAGTVIPGVRRMSEQVARQARGVLIRINPKESDVPPGQIGLAQGACEALQAIAQYLRL